MSKIKDIIGKDKYNDILREASWWLPHDVREHLEITTKVLFDALTSECPKLFNKEYKI